MQLSEMIDLFELFNDYNIPFDVSDFSIALENIKRPSEITELIKYYNSLKNKSKEILEELIVNYVCFSFPENSSDILTILPEIKSIKIFKEFISKASNLENKEAYIKTISDHPLINSLSEDFIQKNIEIYFLEIPISALLFLVKHFQKLYVEFCSKIVLNRTRFIDMLRIIFENAELLKPFIGSKNTINTFLKNYITPNDFENMKELNEFFKKNNYAFQSDYIKFQAFLLKEKKITTETFNRVLNDIELFELGAVLIKSFLENKEKTRTELMPLMNRLLKQHFVLLSNEEVTNDSFNNIFSIEGLVKKCDGRKKYSGLNFWQGGNISRWYTDGNHYITSGKVENMYCEGRFWKNQRFYHSGTNKTTEESYNFYWCKNEMCAGVNDNIEFEKGFENWTLVELNDMFSIQLDRLAFTHLAGWLNRMKTIFDRLKCDECGNYLRPKNFTPHLLGYYAVPIFICVNEKCGQFNKDIRFTHCRGCGKILDSRECNICASCKWLICNDESCKKCGCGANHNPIYAEYV